MRVRNSLGYAEAPGADFDPSSEAMPGTRNVFTFSPGARGAMWTPTPGSPTTGGETRARPFATLPAPPIDFFPRGGSPEPLDLPRITPAPRDFTPRGGRGGTPAPAPAVTRMWNVSPAIPEGTFRPTVPPGARFPEVFTAPDGRPNLPGRALPGVVTAPDGRRWYIPPQPRRLPGDMFWLRLLNLLRGGAAPAPSTTAPTNTVLLPAYPFPEGDFGPGTATAEDPERTQVPTDDGKRFPFLAVLLLGGGAFLAYRVVRGKKGAQVKAA
jgi:hypothetical protein